MPWVKKNTSFGLSPKYSFSSKQRIVASLLASEERCAGDRADRVAAFRAVVAEARALAACDEKRGDSAGLELLLSDRDGLGELLALEDGDLRGPALRVVDSRDACLERLLAVGEALRLDLRDLLEERLLPRLRKLLPPGEDMSLSALVEHLLGLCVVHFLLLVCR